MNKDKAIQKMYAENKEKWLKTNNFSAEGVTYIVTGETYSIKEQLKADGFYYHPILMWHRASCEGYENRVIKVDVSEVAQMAAWGAGWFLPTAKEYIKNRLAEAQPSSSSNWVGEVGKPLPATLVKLDRSSVTYSRFGVNNVYTFVDENDNYYTWFTSVKLDKEVGEWFCITAKIKDHITYLNIKRTQLKNVKIIEEEI